MTSTSLSPGWASWTSPLSVILFIGRSLLTRHSAKVGGGKSSATLIKQAARVGVHVEARIANETEKGHPGFPGQRDCQARRRTDRRDQRDPGHRRLLHELKADTTADHQ